MTDSELLEILAGVVAEQTGQAAVHLTRASVASDIEGWDSLAHGRIILSLEDRLDIMLPDDRVFALENVGDLVRECQKALSGTTA